MSQAIPAQRGWSVSDLLLPTDLSAVNQTAPVMEGAVSSLPAICAILGDLPPFVLDRIRKQRRPYRVRARFEALNVRERFNEILRRGPVVNYESIIGSCDPDYGGGTDEANEQQRSRDGKSPELYRVGTTWQEIKPGQQWAEVGEYNGLHFFAADSAYTVAVKYDNVSQVYFKGDRGAPRLRKQRK